MSEGFPNPYQEDYTKRPSEEAMLIASKLSLGASAYLGLHLDREAVARLVDNVSNWLKTIAEHG